jgi:hypothetical protein
MANVMDGVMVFWAFEKLSVITIIAHYTTGTFDFCRVKKADRSRSLTL